MKIVIDIAEDDYRKVFEGRASVAMMRNAIRNGTVLPKAYGRLIVLNDLYDFDRRKVEYAPTIIKAERGE